jgi:hypothetical protein
MKFIIIGLLACNIDLCYSQRADTTIHKRHYSFCSYYPGIYDHIGLETQEPKILFCLGNYQETLKTGHWLYFFPGGQLLAQGNYEKGIKTGKWKYYLVNENQRSVIKFNMRCPSGESISFGPGMAPKIQDTFRYLWRGKTCERLLINGMPPPSPITRILD